MHGEQASGLFDRKMPLFIGFDVEMADARVFFVEKVLLSCDRRLGGVHGMHLCTSANHSHWTSPFALLPEQKCLDEYINAPRSEANVYIRFKLTENEHPKPDKRAVSRQPSF